MIEIRISLKPDRYERLAELAVRESKSVSKVVRERGDTLPAAKRSESAWDRFPGAAGSYRAAADVFAHHDEHLYDVLARERGKIRGRHAPSC